MRLVEIPAELFQSRLSAYEMTHRKGDFIIETIKKQDMNTSLKKKMSKGTVKTKIIVKDHFAEQGKNLEELLTDIIVERAKRISM